MHNFDRKKSTFFTVKIRFFTKKNAFYPDFGHWEFILIHKESFLFLWGLYLGLVEEMILPREGGDVDFC